MVPETNLSAKYGLPLARTLVSSRQPNVYARILNPGKTDVKIQKGPVLGLFERVAEVEQSNVNDIDQEFVSHINGIGEESLPFHIVRMNV